LTPEVEKRFPVVHHRRYNKERRITFMTQLTIDLPESTLKSLKIPKDQMVSFFRGTIAVALYREGRVSLGKAKEIAGLENKWEMIQLLGERGVHVNYTAEDAKEDLETLNRVLA
jgi:predicted HTH domain antitoxin